jgi:hypothetical protein
LRPISIKPNFFHYKIISNMKMKTVLLTLVGLLCLAATPSFAITNALTGETSMSTMSEVYNTDPNIKELSPEMLQMNLTKFLTLTPAKYKEMTGKRLGLRKSLALKAAQKVVKSKLSGGSPDLSKGAYIILAILGLGWLALGLVSDWKGNEWLYCLLLGLCWLPGVIYAFIKMKNYYS